MTASQQAKRGGINVQNMADILGYSRPHLHKIFNENPQRFNLMLFDAMREKCERNVKVILES